MALSPLSSLLHRFDESIVIWGARVLWLRRADFRAPALESGPCNVALTANTCPFMKKDLVFAGVDGNITLLRLSDVFLFCALLGGVFGRL